MPESVQNPLFEKNAQTFACKGMALSIPVDQLEPGKFPLLVNVRVNRFGQIDSRAGYLPLYGPLALARVHSLRRLNDDVPGSSAASAIVSGVGAALFINAAQKDTGYSGDPLSMVPFRPERSVQSWMYIADSLRMRKVKTDGINFQWGIAPPQAAPAVAIGPANYLIFADCDATTGWANTGTAGALTSAARYAGTQALILSDVGSTGWSSVRLFPWVPGASTGADITIAGERVLIQQVLPAPDSVLISSVAYDSGASGSCVIHSQIIPKGVVHGTRDPGGRGPIDARGGRRSGSRREIEDRLTERQERIDSLNQLWVHAGYAPNSWVDFYTNATQTVYLGSAIVQSVSRGPDGTASIRLKGPAGLVAGSYMVGRPSIRCYFTTGKTQLSGNQTPPQAVAGSSVQSTVGAGIGILTLATPVNLAQIPTSGGNVRAVQDSDVIHVSVQLGDVTKIQEVRIMFDVSAVTNDFAHNFYYHAVRQNDLAAAIKNQATQSTAKQIILQRDVVDSSPRRNAAAMFQRYPTPIHRPIPLPVPRQPSGQTVTGDGQWTEIRFKISDLQRVGGDGSRTLANVAAIRVQVTATSSVQVNVDSFWIGGTFGPEVGQQGVPYLYRGRYRSSSTGARSQLSPPTRAGLMLHRQSAVITPDVSSDAQVDRYDVFRYGGTLPEWIYVGSAVGYETPISIASTSAGNPTTGLIQCPPPPSAGAAGWTAYIGAQVALSDFFESRPFGTDASIYNGTWTIVFAGFNFFSVVIPGIDGHSADSGNVAVLAPFTDAFADDQIANEEQATFDDFQPFPDLDIPRRGICNVVGSAVTWVSGDPFNLAWWQGSEILINGILYNLYAQPSSAAKLELVQNAGTQTNVTFEVMQATLIGQPMPVVWGPSPDTNFIFACGSKYQPGVLFWTKGNNADSASDVNQLEISGPSEPLLNGGFYDGRGFVASSERFWVLYPAFNTAQQWTEMEVPVGRGLFSRWFMCVGKKGIYFGSKDGIYRTNFGPAQSITDLDMYDLFPHGGEQGKAATVAGFTVNPPDFLNNPTALRLGASDGLIYFDFIDTNGQQSTLVFDERLDGWVSYDVSSPKMATHYALEGRGAHGTLAGGIEGGIYQVSGTFDQPAGGVATNIAGDIAVAAFDGGDVRARKLWKEFFLQASMIGAILGITVKAYNGLYAGLLQTDTIVPGAGQGAQSTNYFVVDMNGGEGRIGRTMGCLLQWSEQVKMTFSRYAWYFEPRVEEIFLRKTPYDDLGYQGSKFIQGVIIDADTAGQIDSTQDTVGSAVPVDILDDTGAVRASLVLTHGGRQEVAYSFTPFLTHMVRLSPTDPAKRMQLFKLRWIFEPAPESTTVWKTQGTTHDLKGYQHVADALIAMISNDVVNLTVAIDGAAVTYAIPSTGGKHLKQYLRLQAKKGRVFEYTLQSTTPFMLFAKDSEVRVKAWGTDGPYEIRMPFGDISRIAGAQI